MDTRLSQSPADREREELALRPVSFRDACAFIRLHHRHHQPPQGHKFSVGVTASGRLAGVATVGRPVARHLDDGWTAEVTRCCTDGTPNACSILYGAARRAAKALGYRRLLTYTLASETGTTLRAAGWHPMRLTCGGSWSREKRPRTDLAPTGPKRAWEAPEMQTPAHAGCGACQTRNTAGGINSVNSARRGGADQMLSW